MRTALSAMVVVSVLAYARQAEAQLVPTKQQEDRITKGLIVVLAPGEVTIADTSTGAFSFDAEVIYDPAKGVPGVSAGSNTPGALTTNPPAIVSDAADAAHPGRNKRTIRVSGTWNEKVSDKFKVVTQASQTVINPKNNKPHQEFDTAPTLLKKGGT
jgi:hypothetical protein